MLMLLMMLMKGGMGAVARDNKGKFMIACCKEIHFVADSFMAEAYALREGLSMAQYLGSNKFVIQSDNIQVIQTMLEGGFSSTASAAIFDDCRSLASVFRSISFEHCNREANEVAHSLARHSYTEHIDCFWDDDHLAFYSLN